MNKWDMFVVGLLVGFSAAIALVRWAVGPIEPAAQAAKSQGDA